MAIGSSSNVSGPHPSGLGTLDEEPRQIVTRLSATDRLFLQGVRGVGVLVLLIVSSIALFLGLQAYPTLRHYGWSFFTETRWLPNRDVLGTHRCCGTAQVAGGVIIAFPLAFSVRCSLLIRHLLDCARHWYGSSIHGSGPEHRLRPMGFALIEPHATHIAHWLSKYFG